MATRHAYIAAACAALAFAGCSAEQEEHVDEEFPVAAPAAEMTAPMDTTDSIPADTGNIVPVP